MISSLIQLVRRLKRTVHVSLREQEEMPVLDMHASTPAVPTNDAYQHIDSFEDITQMQPAFRTLKVDWCGSTSAVTACVAELEGPRYVVFVKPREVDTDIFRAVEQRAIDAAKGPVQIYTINPVILLTLVRERMQAQDVIQRSSRIRGQKEKSAVRQGFYDIVSWAVRNDASDLHLNIDTTAAKSRISATIDGQYTTPEHLAMPTQQLLDMASVAWLDVSGGNGLFLDMANEQQGRLYEVVDERSYMLRWGSFIADKGPSITLRLLDVDSKVQKVDMSALGYLPSQIAQFERAMRSMGGAIVMGGIPGSGKTVSIAQLIVRLPKTRKRMSIEDPVELIMEAVLQASVSRSLDGSDRDTMKSKLMALKRAAASDVFLGEIRDVLTGAAFQDIVLSGSNLYCTTHVGGALAIPQRFASSEIGIPRSTLGTPGVLKLLVHQALMPKLCRCALPAVALLDGAQDRMGIKRDRGTWQQYLADIEALYDFGSDSLKIRNPDGCEHCRKKGIPELFGYASRTAVAELFEPSGDPDALRAIANGDEIRLRAIFASQRTARYDEPDMEGKSTMECAVYKMSQGMIDPRDIEPHFTAYATLLRQRKKG